MDATARRYGWTRRPVHSDAYLLPAVLRLLARYKPRTVIDAGCGTGAITGAIAASGYDVIGVDRDAGGIEIAREDHPGARFEVSSFVADPPAVVDMVVSTEVIEHLYHPGELIAYAYRALNPDGVLVLSTPYHGYLKNLAMALVDGWDAHHVVSWTGGHIKFFSRRSLTAMLARRGFRVVEFVGVGRAPFLWKSMILVARPLPPVG